MQAIYHILYPDGAIETNQVEWPALPDRSEVETLIGPLLGGDPAEHVTVLYEGEPRDMFVSELGHEPVNAPLPVNPAATKIFRANVLADYPDTDPDRLPAIAGPAVLFANRVVW
jgi:hypothetical protein